MQPGLLCNSLASVQYGTFDVPVLLVLEVINESRTRQKTLNLIFNHILIVFPSITNVESELLYSGRGEVDSQFRPVSYQG